MKTAGTGMMLRWTHVNGGGRWKRNLSILANGSITCFRPPVTDDLTRLRHRNPNSGHGKGQIGVTLILIL